MSCNHESVLINIVCCKHCKKTSNEIDLEAKLAQSDSALQKVAEKAEMYLQTMRSQDILLVESEAAREQLQANYDSLVKTYGADLERFNIDLCKERHKSEQADKNGLQLQVQFMTKHLLLQEQRADKAEAQCAKLKEALKNAMFKCDICGAPAMYVKSDYDCCYRLCAEHVEEYCADIEPMELNHNMKIKQALFELDNKG